MELNNANFESKQSEDKPATLLIGEEEILDEEFLERISDLLVTFKIPDDDNCNTVHDTTPEDAEQLHVTEISLRANLHGLICFDPIAREFRNRFWKLTSLLNRCTMNWLMEWPPDAFHTTALFFLKEVGENEEHNNALARVCVAMYYSVAASYQQLNIHNGQRIYIGPNHFVDQLELYGVHLKRRSELLVSKRTHITNGLNKILSTNEMVLSMQEELKQLVPKVEIQSKEIERHIHRLTNDTKTAADFRIKVMQEEAEAKEREIIMRAIADDANCDLEVTTPSIKMAQDALKAINKNDLNELKAMTSPPPLVMFVLEAVCVLLGVKPAWDAAKKILSEPSFPKRLMDFDKGQITDVTMKKIKSYIEHKDFDPLVRVHGSQSTQHRLFCQGSNAALSLIICSYFSLQKIEATSRVAKLLSIWVSAIDKYAVVYKIVEPKLMKARNAENDLKEV